MKNARSLKTIAAEIHELERASVFDASAENYMNAARVAKKFVTVTNLKVPLRIIYDLDPDDPDLPDDIEVLSQASKHRQLTVSEAVDVLELARMRREHGDHPLATLHAMDDLYLDRPWCKAALERLKAEQPTTDEAAAGIVAKIQRAHVNEQLKGEIPAWVPDDRLFLLEKLDETEREPVLKRLLATPPPTTREEASDAMYKAVWGNNEDGDDEPESEPEPKAEPEGGPEGDGGDAEPAGDDGDDTGTDDDDDDGEHTATTDDEPFAPSVTELVEALNVILHYARKPAPTAFKSKVTGAELAEIRNYVETLHKLVTAGSVAKTVADRAEARSKRNQQTEVAL